MKCYNCGSFLYESNLCPSCGADVEMYRKIVKKSNELYNRGLSYARVRNLSSAINCLEVSLRMYKGNVNARNLLGLVYFETGEYTKGLAQWIISKNLQADNNTADYFLELLKKNQSILDLANTTTRKYNKVLDYIKQDNFDLAEIQLKKLLNDNPQLLKGHQLLALLHIRKKKYSDARLALKKAEKIDAGNPTTISYLNFINTEIKDEEKGLSSSELKAKHASEKEKADHTPLSGDDVIIPKSSYREYATPTMTVVQILIGLVLGAAIVFFIVLPAKTKALRAEQATVSAEYESKIEQLNTKITSLEAEINDADKATQQANYKHLVSAYVNYINEDTESGKEELLKVQDVDRLMDEEFVKMYDSISTILLAEEAKEEFNEGLQNYENGYYNDASDNFTRSIQCDRTNSEALYYLGMCYKNLERNDEAVSTFNQYIEQFPEGDKIKEIQSYIKALQ